MFNICYVRQIVRDIGEITNARDVAFRPFVLKVKEPVIQITLAKAQVLNK